MSAAGETRKRSRRLGATNGRGRWSLDKPPIPGKGCRCEPGRAKRCPFVEDAAQGGALLAPETGSGYTPGWTKDQMAPVGVSQPRLSDVLRIGTQRHDGEAQTKKDPLAP